MAETRQSTMQRVQVGLVGLVVVLVFVSLANMALDRASNAPVTSDTTSAMPDAATGQNNATAPAEPMAELGVAPVSKDASAAAKQQPDTSNVQTTARQQR